MVMKKNAPVPRTASSTRSSKNTVLSHDEMSPALRTRKIVGIGRAVFLCGLVALAALLGYGAYHVMRMSEVALARERFESIVNRAQCRAQEAVEEKILTTRGLANMAAASQPYAADWPNVFVEGFEEVSTNLREISKGQEIALCPIIFSPGGEQQTSFENFAYEFYQNRKLPTYPEDMGVSSFGKGIFSFGDPNAPDFRYHDTTGNTTYGSKNQILVPALQLDQGYHPAAMLNVHFEQKRGEVIDSIIECSHRRAMMGHDAHHGYVCGSMTDMMPSQSQHADHGPGALMMEPIYPKFDNTTLTGLIVSKMIWDEVLHLGFDLSVNGLDVVLQTETSSYTYQVVNGEAMLLGEGDLHCDDAVLVSPVAELNGINGEHEVDENGKHGARFSEGTVIYTLQIYSTAEYMSSYQTNNPIIACIGTVAIILFTSLLFLGYDGFVRREIHDKNSLLQAKRRFVRFISHEVRTPLNTVCMGLTLLKDKVELIADAGVTITPDGLNDCGELISDVENNAQVAVGVLNDLLNYDKIMMGNLTLELDVFPIWGLVERTTEEFMIAASKKKVCLRLDAKEIVDETSYSDPESQIRSVVANIGKEFRSCQVLGDSVRLAQVLRNIISNALKFTPEEGNVTVQISVVKPTKKTRAPRTKEFTRDKEGAPVILEQVGMVLIQVVDDGAGMSPDQVEKVFSDGTQFNVNKLQAGGGTGLGLAVSRGIAQQHDGSLECSSPGLGKGTNFTLSLPLYGGLPEEHDEVAPLPKKESHSRAEKLQCTHNVPSTRSFASVTSSEDGLQQASLRLLVVDDAKLNRRLCMRVLVNQGHECDGAEDGVEACDMVQKSLDEGREYDCILCDYCMPNMNGPEACAKIRAMGSSAFIVGVTGNLMDEDVNTFRQNGANWVLPKPFNLEAFNQLLVENGVLGGRQHISLPGEDFKIVVEPEMLATERETEDFSEF